MCKHCPRGMAVTYRLPQAGGALQNPAYRPADVLAKAFSKKTRVTENEGFGVNAPDPSPFSGTVIPGWSEGPDPESRDSGFVLRTPRNDAERHVPAFTCMMASAISSSILVRSSASDMAMPLAVRSPITLRTTSPSPACPQSAATTSLA